MADAEAAARAIVEILATGDLDAVSDAVADDCVDHQGLGELEIRGQRGFRRVIEAVQRETDGSADQSAREGTRTAALGSL